MSHSITPIGLIHNNRKTLSDDQWGSEISLIELLPPMQDSALDGIEEFSHAEIIFLFDRVDAAEVETGSRHPRGNPAWPKVGIFAQRGKDRPNRLGATIVRIVKRDGRSLTVQGLDALDNTPVIDIKPVMQGFFPTGNLLQPGWASELMRNYWNGEGISPKVTKSLTPPTAQQRLPEYIRGEDWIREFLRKSQVAHIGHIAGGQPFITPTVFWFDEEQKRIIFHGNRTGRLRSNLEGNPRVCVEVSETGRLLPANTALEFSLQYRSVMAFGRVVILAKDEGREALNQLLLKYFPTMRAGREFRPITEQELKRTSVYAVEIESWSGKENWQEQAEQSEDWPRLPEELG